MDNKAILERLKAIQSKLEDGLGAEFEEQEKTDPEFQFDARIIESRIELDELINDLFDDTNDISSSILKIDIGEDNTEYVPGKLTVPKNNEIDKIDEEHIKWGTRKN
jgi:hypothetical protein